MNTINIQVEKKLQSYKDYLYKKLKPKADGIQKDMNFFFNDNHFDCLDF